MTELERALVALGRELDLPTVPNLAPAVRGRIERRTRARRGLVAAIALAAVAIGVAMAVPQARTAILKFFHIGSVTIERVETLPPAREGPVTAGLGKPRTRVAAEGLAGFRMILPRFKGAPPVHYYARPGLIATTIRSGAAVVLLTELRGDQIAIGKKFVIGTTTVEPAQVGPYFGLFVFGGRHVIVYTTPNGIVRVYPRLAGDVLAWVAHGRTFRLEGKLSRAEFIRLARLVTP
jgi:hypothetical protein